MDKNELIQTVKTMIVAPSCCADLKAAGQKWLDAVGTAEEKAAGAALLQEIKDDVCTIDDVLGFFASPAAEAHFGAEQAKALLAQGFLLGQICSVGMAYSTVMPSMIISK